MCAYVYAHVYYMCEHANEIIYVMVLCMFYKDGFLYDEHLIWLARPSP